MTKCRRWLVSLLLVVSLFLVCPANDLYAVTPQVKNVIIFIGDGAGLEHIRAGRYFIGSNLCFEAWTNAQVKTSSASNPTTDSAAAATAMATGHKVNNGVISVALPGDGSVYGTVLEWLKAEGKRTGLITTTAITDATPAAFGAHTSSRYDVTTIASNLLNNAKPNILFGGSQGLTVNSARAAGYNVISNSAELASLDPLTNVMVSGQFCLDDFPYEYDGMGTKPHLSDMVDKAISILSNEPSGFFLMVESALIDHAVQDITRCVREVAELNNAVNKAVSWMSNRTDTLIIVTADHETGGLSVLADNGAGNDPTVSWATSGHTSTNVGIWGIGPGIGLITGVIENTDIFSILTGLRCNFTADVTNGYAPLKVVFTGSTITNSADLFYRWDFNNDGVVDEEGLQKTVVTNIYQTSGWQSVRLCVSNTAGETAEMIRTNYINVSWCTFVSGTITNDTTWTIAGSPYIISGNLTVNNGVLLTINPGVNVQIHSYYDLIIRGGLLAIGEETNRIIFINYPDSGGCIWIEGGGYSPLTATGVLAHCVFSRLGAQSAAVYSSYANLTISECVFTNILGAAILPYNSRIVIVENVISNVAGQGVRESYCAGLIASNRISHITVYANAIDLNYAWGGPGDSSISIIGNILSDGPDPDADGIDTGSVTADLMGNIISGFGDKGISLGEQTHGNVYNNLIRNCVIGIAVKDASDPVMANNTIVECDYGIKSYIKYGPNGGRGSLINSIIWDCTSSIVLLDDSTLSVGYCDIQGTNVWPGNFNINDDPCFLGAEGENAFSLLLTSPCINAGVNEAWMNNAVDVYGRSRIFGGIVDMGACESTWAGNLWCIFYAGAKEGSFPLKVVFTSCVYGTNTTDLFYRWDFNNDGITDLDGLQKSIVTNIYMSPGWQSVRLCVSNTAGEVAERVRTNYINVTIPTTRYVSRDGSNIPPFYTWQMAATNIQDAVNVGLSGYSVIVSNGTYSISQPVTITNNITIESLNGPAYTVLNGNNSSRCLYMDHTNAVVKGFTIIKGFSNTSDPAVVYMNSGGTLKDCVLSNNFIYGNVASNKGIVHCEQNGCLLNCLIVSNTSTMVAGSSGPAPAIRMNNNGIIRFCTMSENAEIGGLTRRFLDMSNGTVQNSIVQSNKITYNYLNNCSVSFSCIEPAVAGEGNITGLPQFVDASNRNWRLLATSPCIDAGTNGFTGIDKDIEGQYRILDGNTDNVTRADMGCYEYFNPASDSDADGMPDGWESQYGFSPVSSNGSGDADSDGMSDVEEYNADTDPFDDTSLLKITSWAPQEGGVLIGWQGGSNSIQFVECRTNLLVTNEDWMVIFTNEPPTLPFTNITDQIVPEGGIFYRIRARR